MTCIVAIKDKDGIWIGGDSAGITGYDITIRKDPKVWSNGDFIYGITSSFRMGQLLRYRFTPPFHNPDKETLEYMATDFVDQVREVLKQGGYTTITNNEEEGGNFLVVYKSEIFNIYSDFQVGISVDGYDTVGCGSPYAKAVLFNLRKTKISSKQKILKALETAEYFSAGVCAPFNLVQLKNNIISGKNKR